MEKNLIEITPHCNVYAFFKYTLRKSSSQKRSQEEFFYCFFHAEKNLMFTDEFTAALYYNFSLAFLRSAAAFLRNDDGKIEICFDVRKSAPLSGFFLELLM